MNVAVEKSGDKAVHLGEGTENIAYFVFEGIVYMNLDYKKTVTA